MLDLPVVRLKATHVDQVVTLLEAVLRPLEMWNSARKAAQRGSGSPTASVGSPSASPTPSSPGILESARAAPSPAAGSSPTVSGAGAGATASPAAGGDSARTVPPLQVPATIPPRHEGFRVFMVPPPVLSSRYLALVANVFALDTCSTRTLSRASRVTTLLAVVHDNRYAWVAVPAALCGVWRPCLPS